MYGYCYGRVIQASLLCGIQTLSLQWATFVLSEGRKRLPQIPLPFFLCRRFRGLRRVFLRVRVKFLWQCLRIFLLSSAVLELYLLLSRSLQGCGRNELCLA